jgi:hypothetical protein
MNSSTPLRCINTSVSLAHLCKDITENDIFQFFLKLKVTISFDDVSGKNAALIDADSFFFLFLRKK